MLLHQRTTPPFTSALSSRTECCWGVEATKTPISYRIRTLGARLLDVSGIACSSKTSIAVTASIRIYTTMVLLDVLDAAGALAFEHRHVILLATLVYVVLRWLSPASRSWILSLVVIAVLVGMFVHEESLDIRTSIVEGFRRELDVQDAVAEGAIY